MLCIIIVMLCIHIGMLGILLLVQVFLLLCMFHSGYSVSLCCSVYCLCVNVYCTTATRCQPNCIQQRYHVSYHINHDHKKEMNFQP